MGKYKLYFKNPSNLDRPPGEWKSWLPDIVMKHIKLVGVIISVIAVAIMLILFRIMNSDGELTAWLVGMTANIDNAIINRILRGIISLIVIAILIFVHEMLHLLITVGKGDLYIFWNKFLLGISPFSDCELTWGQSFIYKLLPVIVLSGGFYVISLFIHGVAGGFLRYIAIANLGMSSADLLLTPFMFRLPRNAVFYGGLWREKLDDE